MKLVYSILLGILMSTYACGSTTITGPLVSGHWTLIGSPYYIYDNITVPTGSTLTIDRGVQVVFQGLYSLWVAGNLVAIGTQTQPIDFRAQDTSGWADASLATGGWHGINVNAATTGIPDSTHFAWCNIQDMKFYPFVTSRPLKLSNCNFSHNSVPTGIANNSIINIMGSLSDSSFLFEMDSCNIYNNYSGPAIRTIASSHGILHLSNCSIHDNDCAVAISLNSVNVLLTNNSIYNNRQSDTFLHSNSAIRLTKCHGVISGNKIYNNTSLFVAALYCDGGTLDLTGNIICNNKTTRALGSFSLIEGGGGLFLNNNGGSNPRPFILRNNIISNNFTAGNGGGINIYKSSAIITNNTIMNNTSNMGAGIYDFSDPAVYGHSFVKVKNNIFFNNINTHSSMDSTSCNLWAADTFEYTNNFTQITYSSDITTTMGFVPVGDTTTNVIGINPGLIAPTLTNSVTENALLANFGLLLTSPCLNHGDTSNAFIYGTDHGGNARVSGGIIDIGAYEYNLSSLGFVPSSIEPSINISVYPNPAINNLFVLTPQANGIIELRDIDAKVVATKKVVNTITSFDIQSLPRGIYFAVWNMPGGTKLLQKIVLE